MKFLECLNVFRVLVEYFLKFEQSNSSKVSLEEIPMCIIYSPSVILRFQFSLRYLRLRDRKRGFVLFVFIASYYRICKLYVLQMFYHESCLTDILAISLRIQSACGEDLDKILND